MILFPLKRKQKDTGLLELQSLADDPSQGSIQHYQGSASRDREGPTSPDKLCETAIYGSGGGPRHRDAEGSTSNIKHQHALRSQPLQTWLCKSYMIWTIQVNSCIAVQDVKLSVHFATQWSLFHYTLTQNKWFRSLSTWFTPRRIILNSQFPNQDNGIVCTTSLLEHDSYRSKTSQRDPPNGYWKYKL